MFDIWVRRTNVNRYSIGHDVNSTFAAEPIAKSLRVKRMLEFDVTAGRRGATLGFSLLFFQQTETPVCRSKFLWVEGPLQDDSGVVHVKATRLAPLPHGKHAPGQFAINRMHSIKYGGIGTRYAQVEEGRVGNTAETERITEESLSKVPEPCAGGACGLSHSNPSAK